MDQLLDLLTHFIGIGKQLNVVLLLMLKDYRIPRPGSSTGWRKVVLPPVPAAAGRSLLFSWNSVLCPQGKPSLHVGVLGCPFNRE